jgi:hypothetical protein
MLIDTSDIDGSLTKVLEVMARKRTRKKRDRARKRTQKEKNRVCWCTIFLQGLENALERKKDRVRKHIILL